MIFVGIMYTSWDIRYSIFTSGYRPSYFSFISHSPRHGVFRTVQSCCLTSKTYVFPLEFRCYLAYKLRYMLFHIHFRLQAAIFDILLTLTLESVRTSPTVLLNLKNGGFPWKFADISFVSWDPSDIRSVSRHFELLWASLIVWWHLRDHKKCARPVSETRINKFQSVPKIYRGCNFAPPAVYVTNIGPPFEGY